MAVLILILSVMGVHVLCFTHAGQQGERLGILGNSGITTKFVEPCLLGWIVVGHRRPWDGPTYNHLLPTRETDIAVERTCVPVFWVQNSA